MKSGGQDSTLSRSLGQYPGRATASMQGTIWSSIATAKTIALRKPEAQPASRDRYDPSLQAEDATGSRAALPQRRQRHGADYLARTALGVDRVALAAQPKATLRMFSFMRSARSEHAHTLNL